MLEFLDRKVEASPHYLSVIKEYDDIVRNKLPKNYEYPIRLRNWELYKVLTSLRVQDKKILDIGSFNTYIGLYMRHHGIDVTMSDDFSWLARKDYTDLGCIAPYWTWYQSVTEADPEIRIVYSDMSKMRFKDESFDVITCISALEHIEPTLKAWNTAVKEMRRCLKVGGRLLLTTEYAPVSRDVPTTHIFDMRELEILFGWDADIDKYQEPPEMKHESETKEDYMTCAFLNITKRR